MERINKRKNKRGFTLIEMVIVIAICIILAIVVYFTVASYLNQAKSATEKMSEYYETVNSISEQIDNEANG